MDLYFYHTVLKLLVGYHCYLILMADFWLVSPDDDYKNRLFCPFKQYFKPKNQLVCLYQIYEQINEIHETNSLSIFVVSVSFSLTLHTDIWLVVNVPVLSEQMTDVQPRVSTEGKLRTMAFFLAMRRVPRARQVVMTAGRPGER